MAAPELIRGTSRGVTLLGDPNRPGGVTLAFTERTGGVSEGPYASLNLGDACGDDPACVRRNRERALAALGAGDLYERLLSPKQVHGDDVVVVGREGLSLQRACLAVREGADAVVCTEPGVPVLLCYADCVPVVLCAPGAFAVVHSGWRGTALRIAAKALRCLVRVAGCRVGDVYAYVGPHIGADGYEVSRELADEFVRLFGSDVVVGRRNLDLGKAVQRSLYEEGLSAGALVSVEESTATHTDRFFSYRAENGRCGRYGALACLL